MAAAVASLLPSIESACCFKGEREDRRRVLVVVAAGGGVLITDGTSSLPEQG